MQHGGLYVLVSKILHATGVIAQGLKLRSCECAVGLDTEKAIAIFMSTDLPIHLPLDDERTSELPHGYFLLQAGISQTCLHKMQEAAIRL